MKKNVAAMGLSLLVGLSFVFIGCGGPVAADQAEGTLSIDKVDHPRLIVKTDKGDVEIRVEIADTFEERRKGLMFRTSIPDKEGMYFVFEESKKLDFWMKNTLVPLDMIFIDSEYHVVNIAKDVPPCKADPCPSYSSSRAAQYVLEIRGGQSDALGIKSGDTVMLSI